jgi:hypothetical protein
MSIFYKQKVGTTFLYTELEEVTLTLSKIGRKYLSKSQFFSPKKLIFK